MHVDRRPLHPDESRGIHLVDDKRLWCAVYTYPKHERVVSDALKRSEIESYLPTLPCKSRWKDRTVTLQVPVFPGYVFAHILPEDRGRVLTVRGVIRILTVDGRLASIPEEEIGAIRLSLSHGARVEALDTAAVGDKVRVRSGALKGLVGWVSERRENRRLIVPISLIHQSVSVEVDLDLLDPVT
jgi:transcription antitermination factor NusG